MENEMKEKISIYLSKKNRELLDKTSKDMGLSRSAVTSMLINRLESRYQRTD